MTLLQNLAMRVSMLEGELHKADQQSKYSALMNQQIFNSLHDLLAEKHRQLMALSNYACSQHQQLERQGSIIMGQESLISEQFKLLAFLRQQVAERDNTILIQRNRIDEQDVILVEQDERIRAQDNRTEELMNELEDAEEELERVRECTPNDKYIVLKSLKNNSLFSKRRAAHKLALEQQETAQALATFMEDAGLVTDQRFNF